MSEAEARALAATLLAEDLPQRWRHVQGVATETGRLCGAVGLDRALVVSAAWLHDIGYVSAIAETGFHPLDGARYLRAQGWNEIICRLVAHHTSAASQAGADGLAEQLRSEFAEVDGLPRDVLWTADATTGPDGERLTLDERIAEIGDRYGAKHQVARRMIASRESLQAAIDRVTAACR